MVRRTPYNKVDYEETKEQIPRNWEISSLATVHFKWVTAKLRANCET